MKLLDRFSGFFLLLLLACPALLSAQQATLSSVTVQEHPAYSVRPSYFGGPPAEGLPERIQIEELSAEEAIHFVFPFSDIEETVTLVWSLEEDRKDAWFIVQSGEETEINSGRLEHQEGSFGGSGGWFAPAEFEVTAKSGGTVPVHLEAGPVRENQMVFFRHLDGRVGRLDWEGKEFLVGLQKNPRSATFETGTPFQIAVDENGDGKFTLSTNVQDGTLLFTEQSRADQPFLLADQPVQVSDIAPDGTAFTLKRVPLTPHVSRGFPMPDFSARKIDGEEVSLSDLKGKVTVLNWWFTTCPPCLTEMPGMNELVARYADQDVVFLAIARNDEETLRDFIESREFLYEQALYSDQIVKLLGQAFPRHLILDRNGRIVLDRRGGSATVDQILDAGLREVLGRDRTDR